jgi:hypothetical protein
MKKTERVLDSYGILAFLAGESTPLSSDYLVKTYRAFL